MTLSSVVFLLGAALSAPAPEISDAAIRTQPPTPILTLDQCLDLAREQSPLIQASVAWHEAALARVHSARALPNPVLGFDSDLQPKPFHFGQEGESYLGVTQLFEFPGKRSARGKMAKHEAEAVLAQVDLARLSLSFAVKEAFGSLLLAKQKLSYARQNLALANEFLEKTEHKHELGDVAQVERLRARVEASKAANAETLTANGVRLARSRLAHLLARPADQPFDIEGRLGRAPIPGALEPLTHTALEARPELRQLALAAAREQLAERQAKLDYLPDLELSLAQHRIAGEPDTWDVTLSLPVPLFFWQQHKGPVAEARANRRALDREAEDLRNTIRFEVEKAYTNAVSAGDRIRLYEEDILAQAQEVHDMLLFSYQEGEIGGIELIEARRTLIEAQIAHAEALLEYDIAVAALENAVGE